MFGRFRMHKHEQNTKNGIAIHNDSAVSYNINKWFESDNLFCKFIKIKANRI